MANTAAPLMHEYDTFSLEEEEEYFVNEEPVDGRLARKLLDYTERRFRNIIRCPFCRTRIETATAEEYKGYIFHDAQIWRCSYCGFWQAINDTRNASESPATRRFNAHAGKLRSFERLPDYCASELAQALRRRPGLWHTLDPTKFEKFVADVFRANHSHADVIHVGRPDDGGVDVLFIDVDGQQSLIQVKRRADPDSSEGVSTLRNLLGAMYIKGALRGAIVSTADHFTERAFKDAKEMHRKGVVIDLLDRGKLNRMLSPLIPTKAWLLALTGDYVSASVIDKLEEQLSQKRRGSSVSKS